MKSHLQTGQGTTGEKAIDHEQLRTLDRRNLPLYTPLERGRVWSSFRVLTNKEKKAMGFKEKTERRRARKGLEAASRRIRKRAFGGRGGRVEIGTICLKWTIFTG